MNSTNNLSQTPTINTGPTDLAPTTAQSIGNAFGLNNSIQQDFNENMMNRANAFNQFMSDTQYQRTVSDMEKAGINPLIAIGTGHYQLDNAPTSALATSSSNSGQFGGSLERAFGSLINMFKMLFFM